MKIMLAGCWCYMGLNYKSQSQLVSLQRTYKETYNFTVVLLYENVGVGV